MRGKPDFDPEAIIDAMAPLLGLAIDEAYRPGIVTNLRVTAQFAAMILEFPLDDREEPAAVFEA